MQRSTCVRRVDCTGTDAHGVVDAFTENVAVVHGVLDDENRTRVNSALVTSLGPERVRCDEALGPLTTFRTGGCADWFIDARSAAELVEILVATHGTGVPVTMLGGGSNVLIGDGGIRGLVARARHGGIELVRKGVVRAATGVTLNGLVRWTINRGLGGLEAWAGTPGTVGGALFGNAHFRGRLIGDLVVAVGLAERDGATRTVGVDDMEFAYDRSRLQRTNEVALWAEFLVRSADPGRLRANARASLVYRKRTQPLDVPSAGCIFRNPDPNRDSVPEGIPLSAGALVDRAGLKGRAIGRARVSDVHGNFIVSDGHARARDIRALIELCHGEVEQKFGVTLRREVVFLGEF